MFEDTERQLRHKTLQEKRPEPRRYLAEDSITELCQKLARLNPRQTITVVFYDEPGQEYHQPTGSFVKIDLLQKSILIDDTPIRFMDLFDIVPAPNGSNP